MTHGQVQGHGLAAIVGVYGGVVKEVVPLALREVALPFCGALRIEVAFESVGLL